MYPQWTVTLVLISAPHMDYYSWILHLKSICITVFYQTFILINTRNMIYYIVIIYYEPLYKICIYFLKLFLISNCTFGNVNNISIIIHSVCYIHANHNRPTNQHNNVLCYLWSSEMNPIDYLKI